MYICTLWLVYVDGLCAKCFHQIFHLAIINMSLTLMLLCTVFALHQTITHMLRIDDDKMYLRIYLHIKVHTNHTVTVVDKCTRWFFFRCCSFRSLVFLFGSNWKYRLKAQVCNRIYFTWSFCLQLYLSLVANCLLVRNSCM